MEVKAGDLFEQDGNLVIGFNDVFDTDIAEGSIVNPGSVQGQFLLRVYGGDVSRLDRDLDRALSGIKPVKTEELRDKPQGKRVRYPIPTVATLGQGQRRYFCVAYSEMQNNLVAKSSIDKLWQSLGALWDAVYVQAQRGHISMPIVGSELARVNCVDRESLLRMIILSFVARSREEVVSKRLTVVIRPSDLRRIHMLEIQAFLRYV